MNPNLAKRYNIEKSAFYVYHKAAHDDIRRVEEYTGFHIGTFPLTYLGCPTGHAKKRKVHLSALNKKVQAKLEVSKGKLLSFGGKVVLINSVLQSIPIYQLSVIIPPKCVLYDIQRIFARFL